MKADREREGKADAYEDKYLTGEEVLLFVARVLALHGTPAPLFPRPFLQLLVFVCSFHFHERSIRRAQGVCGGERSGCALVLILVSTGRAGGKSVRWPQLPF